MFPQRRKTDKTHKIIKNHKKQHILDKLKSSQIIKDAILLDLKKKRSKQDKLNNAKSFWENYNNMEDKKRLMPKKKIHLQKVSFSLHKCLTEIFTNVTFKKIITSLWVA